MKNKLVIGGGVAGLIAAFYEEAYVVDTNFLGQLNTRFIPGPRVFKYESTCIDFIKKIIGDKFEIKSKTILIGFKQNDFIHDYASDFFKERYSLTTRGKREYESSFLSSGASEINVITISNLSPSDTYVYVFQKLLEHLKSKNKTIANKIVKITNDTVIFSDDTHFKYDKLISTINLNILCDLVKDSLNDFEKYLVNTFLLNKLAVNRKCFYKLEKEQSYFDYIYSIDGDYTRKTFFDDYCVVETIEPSKKYSEICLDKYEHLPLQIQNSLYINTFYNNIQLLGRFAEWRHDIKANEIINKYERQKA